jgi:hypothetical protein
MSVKKLDDLGNTSQCLKTPSSRVTTGVTEDGFFTNLLIMAEAPNSY